MKVYTKENQAEKFGWIKTNEKIEITFNGWDGKSYNGESRKMNVWVSNTHPEKKFVYKRQGGFESWQNGKYKADCIFEVTDEMILNTETGEYHPEVELYWSVEVPYIER